MAISYAKIVSAPRPKTYTISKMDQALAFGLAKGALWGDIDAYNPKEDGPHEAYFLESARKRTAVVKEVATEEDIEAEKQRFNKGVERRERLQEQARAKAEEEARIKAAEEKMCKCGCGKEAHLKPLPEFAGYCCNWCRKHKGKRGHGPACGNN